jgi:NADH:ubiquinone oxidoreductase subunit 4 (subunit M)
LIYALSVVAIVYTSLVALMQEDEEAYRLFVGCAHGLRHRGCSR